MAPRRRKPTTWIKTQKLPNKLLCGLFHGPGCVFGCGGWRPGKKRGTMDLDEDPFQEPDVAALAPEGYTCPDCRSYTKPKWWKYHYCIPYDGPGKKVQGNYTLDVTKKRWDPALGCWVLVTEKDLKPPTKPKDWGSGAKAVDDYYATSCEIGEYKPKSSIHTDKSDGSVHQYKGGYGHNSHGPYYNNYNGYKYVPRYPWEGIDRTKWKNTWMTLLRLYHDGEWWRGKTISDADWDARLKGQYPPEPKTYYRHYNECEG